MNEAESLDVTAAPAIPSDIIADVRRILDDKQLAAVLAPLGGAPRVHIEAIVDAGKPLAAAHHNWQEARLAQIDGLRPFARQQIDAITPSTLVRVICECVQQRSGGMSSYYGFRGHFVSLLVSIAADAIWDARVEEAS
jgi:hypothetical protein